MKKYLLSGVCAVALSACGGGGGEEAAAVAASGHAQAASAAQFSAPPPKGPDITVMLMNGATIQQVASAYGAKIADQFGKRPIYRLELPVGTDVDGALSQMGSDSRIRFAESNAETASPETHRQDVWAVRQDVWAVRQDVWAVRQDVWAVGGETAYATQWAPDALALSQAHAIATGNGVRVAVLDTGVDATHPALASKMARRADGSVLGFDFVDFDNDASEGGSSADRGWGHGTHVAGLVSLSAPNAKIMPVRVLDAGGKGNAWVLAEALMWAIDPDGNPKTDDGAHVVNMSMATVRPTRLLNTAIELATCTDDDDNENEDDYSDAGFDDDKERCNTLHGVVVVTAAGNGGSATEQLWPAAEAAEGQLSIAASNRGNALSFFSNSGDWINLASPGESIVSTVPGGGYATWNGTSMATPFAAGIAALVLEVKNDLKPVDVTKRLKERSAKLCGTSMRGLHALGAVADFVPGDPFCP
jgi:subtilisin family serine protease